MLERFDRITFFLGTIVLAVGGSGVGLKGQSAAPPTPSVQIVSVTVHPQTIHKELTPMSATVKVVLHCDGPVPAGAKAEVSVSTYSAQPPGNGAAYIPPRITLPLKRGKTLFRVKMQAGPQTVSGSIVVCATIMEYRHATGDDKMPLTVSGFPISYRTPGSPWQKVTVKTLVP
jgi:hypothetical protein